MNDNQGQPLKDSSSQPVTPYPNLDYLKTWVKYGCWVMTPKEKVDQWAMSQRDVDGTRFAKCTAVGKTVACN